MSQGSLPSLRGFLGAIALTKTTAVTAVRELFQLQGGLTRNDTDVRDVVNAAIEALDTVPETFFDGASPGDLGSTTPGTAALTMVTLGDPASSLGSTTYFYNAQVSTEDSTPTNLVQFLAPDVSIFHFRATVVAVQLEGAAYWEQDVKASFKVSGTATELGTSTKSTAKTDGVTTDMEIAFATDTSPTRIQLQVTGRDGELWFWGAVLEVTKRKASDE
jgi:hypothetical protein